MNADSTHSPRIERLERSSSDSILAGVAGGLGRYFELNPAVFRLGFVVLTLLGGVGVLVYLAAVLVMPREGAERSIAADVLAQRRDRPWPVVGLGLAAVALLLLVSRGRVASSATLTVVLLAGLAVLWLTRGQRRARRLLVAVSSVAGVLLVLAVAGLVTAFTWFNVDLGNGVGDQSYTPATAAAIHSPYELGVGNLRLDLSHVAPGGRHHITAKVGVGELRIVVPRTADVRVDAHAKVGDVYVFQNTDSGHDARIRQGSGGFVIDATVGAGRIDVVRAG